MGITKSAVIGKAHRLRLPAREAPANIAKQKSRGVVSRPAARSNRELPVAGSRAASPSRPRAAIPSGVLSSAVERLGASPKAENLPGAVAPIQPRRVFSRACCFPMWRGKERATHVYCEAPVVEGADGKPRQYCAAHYAECYTTPAKNPTNPPPATWLKNRGVVWARG
jgi:GcrA cell cycle regulator